jgi:hypothetical protein
MTIERSEEYVQRAEADRDYWLALAPSGYRLMGFTYRESASYAYQSTRYEGVEHTINVTDAHIKFFNPSNDEEE